MRRARGRAVADYVVRGGWLGPVLWESSTTPLSTVEGRRSTALVRLAGEDTDRASGLSESLGARQAG